MLRPVRVLVAFVWLAVPLALLGAPTALAQAAAPRTIIVSGEGRAEGAPDRADVTAGVVSEAATAAEAVTANSIAMTQVFATLEAAGIARARIQTADFSVQPVFAQRRPDQVEMPRITGYRVSSQVRIVVEDLATLGTTLDALVRSGANQLHGISFSLGNPRPLAEQARRAAVADAAAKAATLAAAAGVRLGPVQSIQESGGGTPAPVLRMAQAEMAVPVAPGELTVRVGVTITYAIE